jgi:tetratricopeptide (TPR) repeat protein
VKKKKNKFQPASRKSAPPKPAAAAPVALSQGKRWLFRIILLVVLPALLLGGLEAGLRLVGYGFSPDFFKKIRRDGKDYYINNENFTLRFFPPQLARWPDPFIFPAQKAPDTIRVFVFGESAAMGDPQPAFGASRYLEMQLRGKFPGKKIEMINLGITAINSHVILPIARECARHDGDFWIIYMGNNEMVGPFGAATVFGAQALPRKLAQLNVALQATRTGQLLVSCLRKLGGKAKNTSWGGMEMFLENRIAPGDPRKETVYRNFEGNLRDIVALGVNSGAHVILNTMSVNLKDSPPFGSLANSNLPAATRERFAAAFAGGKASQVQSNFAAAVDQFAQAVKLDPQFAEAHFRLGQCELALTNFAAAADQFQLACDSDALPFRSDTRINQVIRKIARNSSGERLTLCDAERDLALASPENITGNETFWEHVHFNFDGNYRLGTLWAEQIGQTLSAVDIKPVGTNWLSPESSNRPIGLSIWNRLFVVQTEITRLGQPPLSTRFNNDERLRQLKDQELQLRQLQAQPGAVQRVREGFGTALEWAPSDKYLYEDLANFCEGIHDPQGAIAAYQRMTELMPADFYACLQLGRLLGEQGHPQLGQPYLEEAVRLRPALPFGWLELGSVLTAQKKYAPALDCLKRASRLRPQDYSYACSTGQLLAKLNRHAEATAEYQRAIQLNPGFWQAHYVLAGEFEAANHLEDAAREYAAVLNINSQHVPSYVNLGLLLLHFNQPDEAVKCFENALKFDPDNLTARKYLTSLRAQKAQVH